MKKRNLSEADFGRHAFCSTSVDFNKNSLAGAIKEYGDSQGISDDIWMPSKFSNRKHSKKQKSPNFASETEKQMKIKSEKKKKFLTLRPIDM